MGLLLIFLLEIIGTFILCTIILVTNKIIPIFIALLIAAAIYYFGTVTGGHFNSAVTALTFIQGNIHWKYVPVYIIGQLTGVLLALKFHSYLPLIMHPLFFK